MKARLQIASVAKETGALLTQYLDARGVELSRDPRIPVISYGVPTHADENINGNCGGGDKIRRMNQMGRAGVQTVPWFEGNQIPLGFKFPALARAIAGHGGEDIVPVFEADEVPWRVRAGWNWFSSYIPTHTEYRVWAWRNEILDIYEKVMVRPADYRYIGRNFRNGFDFEHRILPGLVPAAASEQALKTIRAIQFDFAAVDMLFGKDGEIYVLEANSAPGVIKSGAQATLAKLADRMVEWLSTDCPERNY